MSDDTAKLSVLFLCTGNSCRSQMAEGLVNHRMGERWQAFSAGTHPSGFVHPLAIRALAELGIQHQGESKPVERYKSVPFDLVITVCDDANENCPVWLSPMNPRRLGKAQRLHVGFADPARAQGSPEEQMAAFRQVRDEMQERILPILAEYASAN